VLQHFRHLGPDILEDDPAVIGQTVLHDLGVGVVILDRYKMPGGTERTYTEQLAAMIFAGQAPMFEDDRISVYRVLEPATPRPYLMLGELNWGPLQVNAEGVRGRVVGDKPARLYFHHLPPNAQVQLQYRTAPTVGLAIDSLDRLQQLAILASAPTGNQVVLDLAQLRARANATTLEGIVILADAEGGVVVEGIPFGQIV
jgi:hypothetical protein